MQRSQYSLLRVLRLKVTIYSFSGHRFLFNVVVVTAQGETAQRVTLMFNRFTLLYSYTTVIIHFYLSLHRYKYTCLSAAIKSCMSAWLESGFRLELKLLYGVGDYSIALG